MEPDEPLVFSTYHPKKHESSRDDQHHREYGIHLEGENEANFILTFLMNCILKFLESPEKLWGSTYPLDPPGLFKPFASVSIGPLAPQGVMGLMLSLVVLSPPY